EVAAQSPQPRERPVFVGARKPAEADHVGGEDRGELAGLDHRASQMPPHHANSTKTWSAMLFPPTQGHKPLAAMAGMVRLGHLARHRGMTGICAFETFKRLLEST